MDLTLCGVGVHCIHKVGGSFTLAVLCGSVMGHPGSY